MGKQNITTEGQRNSSHNGRQEAERQDKGNDLPSPLHSSSAPVLLVGAVTFRTGLRSFCSSLWNCPYKHTQKRAFPVLVSLSAVKLTGLMPAVFVLIGEFITW